ncbi:hypothetical protein [Pseudomonas putida]|uniref:hypothetical protein n=1 Tax=Pseudomonas putida TaxID=303 RepID=UPI0013A6AFDA|nr:hypothetical protein [Pseudomonas putida]
MIFAQIEKDKVIGIFQSPQDPEFWPGVEEIEDDDQRLIDYLSSAIDVKLGDQQ